MKILFVGWLVGCCCFVVVVVGWLVVFALFVLFLFSILMFEFC